MKQAAKVKKPKYKHSSVERKRHFTDGDGVGGASGMGGDGGDGSGSSGSDGSVGGFGGVNSGVAPSEASLDSVTITGKKGGNEPSTTVDGTPIAIPTVNLPPEEAVLAPVTITGKKGGTASTVSDVLSTIQQFTPIGLLKSGLQAIVKGIPAQTNNSKNGNNPSASGPTPGSTNNTDTGASGIAAGTNALDPNGPKTTTGLPAAAAMPKYVWDGHKYVETATNAQTVMRPDLQGLFQQAAYSGQAPQTPSTTTTDNGTYNGINPIPQAPTAMAKGGPVGIAAAASRLVHGPGDGQSDGIPVQMDDGQPGRLSDGEFVVTADAVAALGNGSTEAGAKILHDMMGRIRAKAHGSSKQSRPVNPAQVLPA
jgi:hypothetical protein